MKTQTHTHACTCEWCKPAKDLKNQHHYAPTYDYWWIPPINDQQSYLKPNARCPECGHAVFFFQTPDGDALFLDEVGPPWPIHTCTNKASRPYSIDQQTDHLTYYQYQWLSHSWWPFILKNKQIKNDLIYLEGTRDGITITITMALAQLPLFEYLSLSHFLLQSRLNPNGAVTLSGLTISHGTFEGHGLLLTS